VCSEDSEASTVYHSCRGGGDSGGSGDNTSTSDPDAASFRSFSTRSISTLNSYQSALSYLSSGTGYLSAMDDTLSNACLADMEEDARTLQGDEFGGQLDFDGMEPVAAAGDQGEGSEGAEERPSSALTNGDSGCSTPVAGGSKYVSVSSSETLENKEEEEDKHDDQEDEEEEEDLTPHGSAANLIIPEDDNTPGPLATHLRVSGSVRLVRSDSCGGGGGDGDAPEDSSLHCDPTSLDNKMEEEGGGEDFSLDVGGLVRNCLEKSIISTATQIEAMPAAAEAASASLPPQQAQPPQSAESSLNCSLSPVQIPKVLNRIPMPTHFEAAQVEPPTPRHIFPELPAPSPRRSPSGGQSPRMGGDGRAVIVFRSDQHEIHDDDDQSSIGSNSNSRSGIWSRRCCGGRGGGSGLSNSQGVLVLIVVIACLVSNQVLMRSLNLQRGQDDSSGGFVNDDDDGKVHHHHQAPSSWWKLVLVRGILQCSLSALLVGVNKVMTTMRDIRSGLGRPSPTSPTSLSRPPPPRPSPSTDLIASYCTFSLQSHRWAYFCQTILTFVFVASTVEAVDRIPASSLATVFHLIPIAIIAADVAVARKTPNFMCYISTILLIASCFMLTWPPASHSVAARHCKTSSADSEAAAAATDCHSPELNGSTAAAAAAAASPSSWLPPFYNADLIYGWPIDPLVLDTNNLGQEVNDDDDVEDGGSGVSQVLTQVVLVVLSMACPVISVILMANRSSLDASKVVFCQGLGALAYCLIDSRRWIGLWYSDDIILAYHLAIAVLGVALNYLFVRLITSKGQKSQPSEEELSVLDDDSPELRAADAAINNGGGGGGGLVGRQNQDPWRHLPMRQAAGRRHQQQRRQRQRRRNLEGGDGGSRGGDSPVPASPSLTVLSRVSHLPTSVTLIIASQLLVFALFNFASGNAAAAAGCCSTLDILGVIGLFCLIVIVTLVGLHPHTKLSDLQFASSGGGGLGGGDDGPKTGLPEPVTSRRAAQ